MTSSTLPAKLYFRIGEVAGLVGVEPHVLRYWEREFRSIRPTKSAKGQRVYSRKDVEALLVVKDLLYQQGFTIAGAKKKLQRPPQDAGHLLASPPVATASAPELQAPATHAAPAGHTAPAIVSAPALAAVLPVAVRAQMDGASHATHTAQSHEPKPTIHVSHASHALQPTRVDGVDGRASSGSSPSLSAKMREPLQQLQEDPLAPRALASEAREKLVSLRGEIEDLLRELGG